MRFTSLVEDMKTIRDFKKVVVDKSLIEEVMGTDNDIRGIIEDSNDSVVFIENGKMFYQTLVGGAGYYGKIIEAPHYLAIVSDVYPHHKENSGYIMEWLRVKAWRLGLGTCWLSIEDEKELKNYLRIKEEQEVVALIAIGHPYKGIFKTDVSPKSSRMGIEDLVYLKGWKNPCKIEYLDSRGLTNIFYYAKFAPSWGNNQPWRFIIDGEKVFLVIDREEKSSGIDRGIIMLYFEKAAHEEGFTGKWNLDIEENLEDKYNIPQNHKIIACYNL
ncbi:Nitroreductase family protein [Natronincola peptidivorans]|uniref:Nitroreductase family protein n=1 Tax=Natronincola peptidivorans TaxID=426128 RepID=A0A1I0DXJ5_9FIRM|nr:nitroreductase family protein [Natronincola peptidivorans]SET36591.1 Nitroreductase family protein [Natronincola peptidivorans]